MIAGGSWSWNSTLPPRSLWISWLGAMLPRSNAFDVQQSPGFSGGQRGVHAPAGIVRREQNLSRAPAASAPPIFGS
jgi:hypothetical protein